MHQAEISELERLANRQELVAPVLYNNPNRKKEVFYDFVRKYGDHIGILIEERTTGFIEDYKGYWEQLNLWLRYESGIPFNKSLYISENAFGLILSPIFYPLVGGAASIIVNGGDIITIQTPKYSGIFFSSDKTHEYMHAYHAIMANDFRKRGLIEIDGFHDVDKTEPPPIIKVPSYKVLKRYERRIINQMIRKIRG